MLHVALTARWLAMRASTLAELGVAGIVLAASWASRWGAQRILVDLSIRPPLQKADCDLGRRVVCWMGFQKTCAGSHVHARTLNRWEGSSAYPRALRVLWRRVTPQNLDGNNDALS